MRTRFAPSPTGPLHLGHAFSALTAFDLAEANRGQFLLRIEDIDQSRARDYWEQKIYSDLAWLSLSWPQPVMRQSEQITRYATALDELWARGIIYPCDCNRRDILTALSAPQEGAPMGPDGVIYPGTCRHKSRPKARPSNVNLRLDMAQALQEMSEISFIEAMFETNAPRQVVVNPKQMIQQIGDVVVCRKDMGTSYHLSVVLDDVEQGITDVVRGEDLYDATPIHVLLQRLVGHSSPKYHHHSLIRNETGKRLAKRDDARAISLYRKEGMSPQELRGLINLS